MELTFTLDWKRAECGGRGHLSVTGARGIIAPRRIEWFAIALRAALGVTATELEATDQAT